MADIDPAQIYMNADRYWKLVRGTLRILFNEDPRIADDLRQDIGVAPVAEQLLFYHTEPLDIAADLADSRDHDYLERARLILQYRGLAKDLGWA